MPEQSQADTGKVERPLGQRMALQALAIVAVSAGLGFSFNALSPLGVRWDMERIGKNTPATAHTHAPDPRKVPSPGQTNPPVSADDLFFTSDPVSVSEIVVTAVPPPAVDGTNVVPVAPPPGGPTPISWAQAEKLIESGQVVMIDARQPFQYEAGHIPGAISLPNASPPQVFQAFRQRYDTSRPIIVYCGDMRCPLSKQLAEKLYYEFGYKTVHHMVGGYVEYLQSGAANKPTTR